MKKLFAFLFTTLSFLTVYCGSWEIKFGHGGGFAGKETTFTLTKKGKLLKQDNIAAPSAEISKMKKSKAKKFLKEITSLNFKNIQLNEPGNMYHFITLVENGKEYKSVWGSKSNNEKLDAFYEKLVALTKENNN